MNQIFATVFSGLFWYLGLALAFVVLAVVLRSPRFKGWRGERAVQNTIRRQLDPLAYVDLHNVTLPTPDGSTQIDHLIFSPYGLFVLETKNYQGWIFGSERQAQWTQQIYKKRSPFQNPLRQNYKHTKALQSLLDITPEQVHSVIAFVGDCEFKTEMPPQVTRGDGFIRHIQSFTQPLWSPEQMQALMDKLEAVRLQPDLATNKQHVAHVKALQAARSKPQPKSRARPKTEPVLMPDSVRLPQPGAVDLLREPAALAAADRAGDTPPPVLPVVRPHDEVPECPQCTWPLRKLLMQRGPLAGQAAWRCSNAAACGFVRLDGQAHAHVQPYLA